MDVQGTSRSQFPPKLSDSLQKRLALDIANRTANLGDDEVEFLLRGIQQDAALDFVGDVGHHLDGLAQIVATSFALNDTQVDATSGDTVVARCHDAREPLVVAKVEVGFHAVGRHIAFAVFVRVQRAWVDVDVGVEFLNGDIVAPSLEQFSYRCRDDAFAQRRRHTTRDEDVFCFHETKLFLSFDCKIITNSEK